MSPKENVLERFEHQISSLLKNYDQLKQENLSLREKNELLTLECEELQKKNEVVMGSIERMIGQLEACEYDGLESKQPA